MHRLHFLTQFVQHPNAPNLLALLLLAIAFLALCYVASKIELTVIVVVGIFLEMFSGSWKYMGVTLPLDRLCLAGALVMLVLKGARAVSSRRIVLRPLHVVLLLTLAWATASAIVAGTLYQSLGFYALLDRFGVVPFLFFFLAPLLFGSTKQRNLLLITLVAIGLYLSATGVFEGLHLYHLVFPRYIANPNVGIQFGRARGPFLDTTGNGFVIFCAVAGTVVALRTWSSRWARFACYVTLGLAGPALLLTLTRAVWIGAILGTLAMLLMAPRTRRWLPPLLVAGTLAVLLSLAISPALRAEILGSVHREASVWDRYNMYLAALRVIEIHPLTGVGWLNFINVSWEYMRQQPGYPITGYGLEVHNIFLQHAADLGVPGFALWTLGLAGAARRALLLPRRQRRSGHDNPPLAKDPRDEWWERWRPAGVAVVLCFLVEASLAPFAEPLANTLIWAWLGVLAIPYTSAVRLPLATLRAAPHLETEQTSLPVPAQA